MNHRKRKRLSPLLGLAPFSASSSSSSAEDEKTTTAEQAPNKKIITTPPVHLRHAYLKHMKLLALGFSVGDTNTSLGRTAQNKYFDMNAIHLIVEFLVESRAYGKVGKRPGEFEMPRSIACHPETGNVFVLDALNRTIQVFSPDMKIHLRTIAQDPFALQRVARFEAPIAITFDNMPPYSLFALERIRRVLQFDRNGAFKSVFMANWLHNDLVVRDHIGYLSTDAMTIIVFDTQTNTRLRTCDLYAPNMCWQPLERLLCIADANYVTFAKFSSDHAIVRTHQRVAQPLFRARQHAVIIPHSDGVFLIGTTDGRGRTREDEETGIRMAFVPVDNEEEFDEYPLFTYEVPTAIAGQGLWVRAAAFNPKTNCMLFAEAKNCAIVVCPMKCLFNHVC